MGTEEGPVSRTGVHPSKESEVDNHDGDRIENLSRHARSLVSVVEPNGRCVAHLEFRWSRTIWCHESPGLLIGNPMLIASIDGMLKIVRKGALTDYSTQLHYIKEVKERSVVRQDGFTGAWYSVGKAR